MLSMGVLTRCRAVSRPTAASAYLPPPVASPAVYAHVKAFSSRCQLSTPLHQGRRSTFACAAAGDVAQTETGIEAGAPSAAPLRNILEVLRERELVQDVTSEDLGATSATEQLTVYVGFDPTADAIHVGNLLGLIVLSWFQRSGHSAVALLGGATGLVGDPSGRSVERPVLSEDQVAQNVAGIAGIVERVLERNRGGLPPVKVVNNYDWYRGVSFLAFLRDVGKYARMGTMLNKDSVRTRLASDAGMSFTEFTYQLLQGYDFVHLCQNEGVRVQVGGSDQWGNITAGTDLVRKLLGEAAPQCFGLTFPLLVDSEGNKIGKSTGGAVWLDADKLSPYKFYQYLFATADADAVRFLKMLTFLPIDDIRAMQAAMASDDYEPNTAQRLLAQEVTRFVHGEEGLQAALKATAALKPGSDTALDAATLEEIAGDAPSTEIARADAVAPLVDVLVAVGLQASKGAARRMIKNGGIYKNNAKVLDQNEAVREADLIEGRLLLLAAGKKNKMLVRIID
eukprot:jgi/Ulvmu1/6319/UM029_0027.1